jgi:hypothetical protein
MSGSHTRDGHCSVRGGGDVPAGVSSPVLCDQGWFNTYMNVFMSMFIYVCLLIYMSTYSFLYRVSLMPSMRLR